MITVLTVLYNSESVWPNFVQSFHDTDFGEDTELLFQDNTIHNIGLSKATNALLSRAKGDIILFANPDVTFNDSVKDMIAFVRSHNRCGAAPMFERNSNVHRRFPNTIRILMTLTFFGMKISRIFSNIRNDYMLSKAGQNGVPSLIEQPGGSFLMLKRTDVDRIASLHPSNQFYDERFPVFWNDVDVSMRADILGIRFALIPSSRIAHEGAHSLKDVKPDRFAMLFWSESGLIGFRRKWGSSVSIIRAFLFLDVVFIKIVKFKMPHLAEERLLRFRASFQ